MMRRLTFFSTKRAPRVPRISQGSSERGQGAVEFAIFLALLVFLLMLIVQIAVIGIQKWQFSHFALYQSRVWSVDKKSRSHSTIYFMVYALAPLRWGKMHPTPVPLPTGYWPLAIPNARFYSGNSDGTPGIHYAGVGDPLPLFKAAFSYAPILPRGPISMQWPLWVQLTKKIPFQTFIPIEHEPAENPNRWDNDCSDPCNDNRR